jgi:predicted TPR repeat methyltransferase
MRLFTVLIPAALFLGVGPVLYPGPANADQNDPRLPELFEALRSPDGDPALIELRIQEAWYAPPEAGIAILFERAVEALNQDDHALALLLAGHVNGLAPSFAEGWMLTGHARSAAGEPAEAGRAYAEAVRLEPNHFEALARLGDIALAAGDKQAALARYREALQINPHMEAVRARAEQIRDETRSQEI